MKNNWIFIIDTDSYAGNFERDMCAYVTGIVGECEVGDEFAALYDKEVNTDGLESVFLDYLEQRADEHGCHRPTSLWPTKGWLSVGNDGAVREEDWNQEEADKAWQEGQAEIYRGYRKQMEMAVVGQHGWTQESKDKELARREEAIAKALQEKAPKSAPNNSVAIFFEKKPTVSMVTFMKDRAYKFAAAKRKIAEDENISYEKNFKLTIHGFRLVKETTKETEEEI
jgi:hypothetical protein